MRERKSNGMVLEGARTIWYRVGDYVTSPGGYYPDLVLRGMICAALSFEVVGVAGHQKSGGWKSGWQALFTCVTPVARDIIGKCGVSRALRFHLHQGTFHVSC